MHILSERNTHVLEGHSLARSDTQPFTFPEMLVGSLSTAVSIPYSRANLIRETQKFDSNLTVTQLTLPTLHPNLEIHCGCHM